MNHLAHAYLSGDSDELLVGNLIGDYVKGTLSGQYSGGIGEGIALHRRIDSFSNRHPAALAGRNRFSSDWRRFAGIILDICFDYFLIQHWKDYANVSLQRFVDDVYARVQPFQPLMGDRLPFPPTRENIGYLLETNADLDGVMFTLTRLSGRVRNGRGLVNAIAEVEAAYEALESDFNAFFPDLIAYVQSLHPGLCLPRPGQS